MRKNESINNRNYIDEDTFFEAAEFVLEEFAAEIEEEKETYLKQRLQWGIEVPFDN